MDYGILIYNKKELVFLFLEIRELEIYFGIFDVFCVINCHRLYYILYTMLYHIIYYVIVYICFLNRIGLFNRIGFRIRLLFRNTLRLCNRHLRATRYRHAPGLRRLRAEVPALSPCILTKWSKIKRPKIYLNRLKLFKNQYINIIYIYI